MLHLFQVRADILATKTKDVLMIYMQTVKSLILRTWENIPISQIEGAWKEGTAQLTTVIQAFKIKIVEAVDIRAFYKTILDVFSKKCMCTLLNTFFIILWF